MGMMKCQPEHRILHTGEDDQVVLQLSARAASHAVLATIGRLLVLLKFNTRPCWQSCILV